jgi:hypothetical protein
MGLVQKHNISNYPYGEKCYVAGNVWQIELRRILY